MHRPLKDVIAGLVFVGFGLAFGGIALTYEIGTPLRMGAGFFPILLAGILVVLGGLIAAKAYLEADADAIGRIPWRALVLILGAVLLFALTVRGLGLIPATFLASFLAALASRRMTLIRAVAIGAGLTGLSVLIFVVALSLRLALVGPWLRI
jgi:hypothetical protein